MRTTVMTRIMKVAVAVLISITSIPFSAMMVNANTAPATDYTVDPETKLQSQMRYTSNGTGNNDASIVQIVTVDDASKVRSSYHKTTGQANIEYLGETSNTFPCGDGELVYKVTAAPGHILNNVYFNVCIRTPNTPDSEFYTIDFAQDRKSAIVTFKHKAAHTTLDKNYAANETHVHQNSVNKTLELSLYIDTKTVNEADVWHKVFFQYKQDRTYGLLDLPEFSKKLGFKQGEFIKMQTNDSYIPVDYTMLGWTPDKTLVNADGKVNTLKEYQKVLDSNNVYAVGTNFTMINEDVTFYPVYIAKALKDVTFNEVEVNYVLHEGCEKDVATITGFEASKKVTNLVEEDDYSIATPELEGFVADIKIVEGKMGKENVKVVVTYKCEETAAPLPEEKEEIKPEGPKDEIKTEEPKDEIKSEENVAPTPKDEVTPVIPEVEVEVTETVVNQPQTLITLPTVQEVATPVAQVATPIVNEEEVSAQVTPKAQPQNEQVEALATPKSNGQAATNWSLISLISSAITTVTAFFVIVARRKEEENEESVTTKKRSKLAKAFMTLLAVASIIVFLLTNDITTPMGLVNQSTLPLVVVAIVQIVSFIVLKKTKEEETQQNA